MNAALKKVYLQSPGFVQDIGSFFYKGLWYERFYKKIKDADYLDRGKTEEQQNQSLRKIVRHCYKNVPFYRKAFDKLKLKPKDVKVKEDLDKLPVVSREDINSNREMFLAKNISAGNLIATYTSGTTGSPIKFFLSQKELLYEGARVKKQFEMAGIDQTKGHFRVGLWLGREYWTFDEKNKVVFFNPHYFSSRYMGEFISLIKKYRFECIRGFPSFIYLLANYCRENNVKDIKFKSAITASEILLPHWRKAVEENFGCRVYNQYGVREATISAMECKMHNGMHIEPTNGITQIGDNNELITTCLVNYTFPLLRYNLKDIAIITEKKCACGRETPRISSIQGRTNDIIVTKDGRLYDASTLSNAIKHLHGHIKECQFVQNDAESLIVNLALRDREKRKKVKQKLRDALKKDFSIKFCIMDNVPRADNGKFKFVVSNFGDMLN